MSIIETKLTREDYEKLLFGSRETVDFFDHSKNAIMHNEFSLYLSNGDLVKFHFNENHVPHLLGFKNLDRLEKNPVGTFYTLKKMTENSAFRRNVIKTIEERNYPYEYVMSKHWEEKVSCIKNQTTAPYPSNIFFVCKYDSSVNYASGETDKYKDCEYYIARKNQKGEILLLGLSREKNGGYFPRTNRIISKDKADEELSLLLKNQVLCYVNTLKIKNDYTNYEDDIFLGTVSKIEAMQNLVKLSKRYHASVDCANNFLHMMKKRTEEKISKSFMKDLLIKFSESLEEGKIIEIDEDEMEQTVDYKEELLTLIDSVNDLVCKTGKKDETKVKYSLLKKQL